MGRVELDDCPAGPRVASARMSNLRPDNQNASLIGDPDLLEAATGRKPIAGRCPASCFGIEADIDELDRPGVTVHHGHHGRSGRVSRPEPAVQVNESRQYGPTEDL